MGQSTCPLGTAFESESGKQDFPLARELLAPSEAQQTTTLPPPPPKHQNTKIPMDTFHGLGEAILASIGAILGGGVAYDGGET